MELPKIEALDLRPVLNTPAGALLRDIMRTSEMRDWFITGWHRDKVTGRFSAVRDEMTWQWPERKRKRVTVTITADTSEFQRSIARSLAFIGYNQAHAAIYAKMAMDSLLFKHERSRLTRWQRILRYFGLWR